MVTVGQQAPAFSLPSTSGGRVSLDELRGRKTVLYFYPRDDTPGCTREACDFRDQFASVRDAGAQVLGVSKDSLASHERFRGKYKLPFELLADEGNAVAKAFGAYGKKKMYGKEVEGTIRSTFLIDEEGRVAAVWSPVKVDGHADAVLAALGIDSKASAKAPARKAAKSKSKTKARVLKPAKPARAPAKKAKKAKSAPKKKAPRARAARKS